MAIQSTNPQTKVVSTLYAGRVVEVRTYDATRNHSDTLDYTDFRTTTVTEALVYVGRTGSEYAYRRLSALEDRAVMDESDKVRELKVNERFDRVDCTNLFVWRGEDHRVATVDPEALANAEIVEDLAAYRADVAERARIAAEKRAVAEKAEKEVREEMERNRPVLGKRMEVFKGRKVPVGTIGTVAFIHYNGGVLLKNDHEWQTRKANGVWVNPENLRARRPCTKHDDCKKFPELGEACAATSHKLIAMK